MTNYVRVKDKATGNEFTVHEGSRHLSQERYEVIDESALDKSGRPRPATYPKTSLAPGRGQATKAATTEAKKEAKES